MQVFMSYAREDAELAHRIAHVLREYGMDVWDGTQILPGDNWAAKIGDALRDSEAMVVLLTPGSKGSANLGYEVGYALGSQDYKGRLIPVVAASPAELPGVEIPWVLNRFPMIRLADPEQDEDGLRKIARAVQEAASSHPHRLRHAAA
jgi:hypothetical protein